MTRFYVCREYALSRASRRTTEATPPQTQLPLAELTSVAAMLLAVVFFITFSDSGSMVIDCIASGGVCNTPIIQRIFWCTLSGSVAAALVLGGDLVALQAMAISTGLPFAIVLLISTTATVNSLHQDYLKPHE